MRRHGNVNLSTHQAYSPPIEFNSEKHADCDNFRASIAGDQLLAIFSYDPKTGQNFACFMLKSAQV